MKETSYVIESSRPLVSAKSFLNQICVQGSEFMNLCSLRIQSQALTLIEWPSLQGTVQTKNDNWNYNGGLGLKVMLPLHIDPQNYAGQDGQYGEGPCPKGRKRERCVAAEVGRTVGGTVAMATTAMAATAATTS